MRRGGSFHSDSPPPSSPEVSPRGVERRGQQQREHQHQHRSVSEIASSTQPPQTQSQTQQDREWYGNPIKEEGTEERSPKVHPPSTGYTEGGGWDVYSERPKTSQRCKSPSIRSVSSVSSSASTRSPSGSPRSQASRGTKSPFLLTQATLLLSVARLPHATFQKVLAASACQLRIAIQHDVYTSMCAFLRSHNYGGGSNTMLDVSDVRCGSVVPCEPSGSILRRRQRGKLDNFYEAKIAICGADDMGETQRSGLIHMLGMPGEAWSFSHAERFLNACNVSSAGGVHVDIVVPESRVEPSQCFSIVHPPPRKASAERPKSYLRRGASSVVSSPIVRRRDVGGHGGGVGNGSVASLRSLRSRRSPSPRSEAAPSGPASASLNSQRSPLFMYSDQFEREGNQSFLSLGPAAKQQVSPTSQTGQRSKVVTVAHPGQEIEQPDFFYENIEFMNSDKSRVSSEDHTRRETTTTTTTTTITKVRSGSASKTATTPSSRIPHGRARPGAPLPDTELELDSVVPRPRSSTPVGSRSSSTYLHSPGPGGPAGGPGGYSSPPLAHPRRRSPLGRIQNSTARSYSGGAPRPPSQQVSLRASARAGPRYGRGKGTTPAAAAAVEREMPARSTDASYTAVHKQMEDLGERMASIGRDAGTVEVRQTSATRSPSPRRKVYHIVMAANGALLRESESLDSAVISVPNTPHSTLPTGTVVEVVETRARRARITSPIPGWLSISDASGDAIIRPLQWPA